jgi:outer membrane protein assembly factor BamB
MNRAHRRTAWFLVSGVLLGHALLAGCHGAAETDRLAAITVEHSVWSASAPAVPSDVRESDWPGWRGGLHGAVVEGDPPTRFRIDEARWIAKVPGEGNSSPVVCGERVFLTALLDSETLVAEGVPAPDSRQLAVICLSRTDGEMLWVRTVGPPQGPSHRRNGYASATPACDGRRVFACFGPAGMACFDLEGSLLWKAELGRVRHQWGVAASPVLFGNLVIHLCDSQAESALIALDAATGRRVWTTPRESQGCWATPVIIPGDEAGRAPLVVVNGANGGGGSAGWVAAYDPATGREVWRVRGTTDIPCPTPVFAEDDGGEPLLISATGGNGPVFAIRLGGEGDATETHVAWRRARGGPYVPSGLAHQGRLYLINDSGVLTCYAVRDGRQVWRTRLRGVFTASLIAADGRIYAVSEQGDVYVLAAGDEYELLAVNSLRERCVATPAISGRQIFVRTEQRLYCFEPAKIVAESGSAAPESYSPTSTASVQPAD